MKRDWLLYLVIFSLALNLGTIGTFFYLRYQDRQATAGREVQPPLPLRELWGALQMDQSQRQALHSLMPDHRRKVREFRRELAQKRQELFDLVKGAAPDGDAIKGKIREISALQGGLEEEVARFLLEVKKHLKPEQHAAFVDLVQKRLGRAMGPRGPRFGPPPGRGPGPHHAPPGPPPESPK
jgi:Spy/CpxP family protein refolding chaperone